MLGVPLPLTLELCSFEGSFSPHMEKGLPSVYPSVGRDLTGLAAEAGSL